MRDKLRRFIEDAFEGAEKSKKNIEIKEEILQNITEKYDDLISQGKSEEAAYNIAVASVGDVGELIRSLNSKNNTVNYTAEQIEESRKKHAFIVSISVMMYILCVLPVVIFDGHTVGLVLMFTIVAFATGMIIYSDMSRIKPVSDESIVGDFKKWQASNTDNKKLFKSVSYALWALTTAIYILISFATHMWHITWVIFLVAGAVEAIIKAVFDFKNVK